MAATPNIHFWDPRTSAYSKIAILYSWGENHEHADLVRHAWSVICDLHFPGIAPNPTASRWSVDKKADRGLLPKDPSRTMPDLIAIMLVVPQPVQGGPLPLFKTRDHLWIECKVALENTPSGWKNVLGEAAHRLSTAHPNRMMFLIIAVGWQCAYFVWNPLNLQPQLHIRHAKGNNGTWAIHPCIQAAGNCPWIDVANNMFNPALVANLDCFTVNAQNVLVHQANLQLIEDFLIQVRNSVLPGWNPPEWCESTLSFTSTGC